ncbi:MAG: type IV toxin-antitoxin system AbiEi family antitoxin domain-containing protein [Candidatus Tectomicrobia bacterium]|nr:type IV toxin-antitoxin system AbiEi family antitoxin domain-containing protein [Candidatus Tectomicrobia bacterium]
MAIDIYPETKRPRARLAAVLQAAKDLVTIDHAVATLGVNRTQAAKLLARWQQQGWLKRVGRGLYAPIPLDAMSTEQVLTDPSRAEYHRPPHPPRRRAHRLYSEAPSPVRRHQRHPQSPGLRMRRADGPPG